MGGVKVLYIAVVVEGVVVVFCLVVVLIVVVEVDVVLCVVMGAPVGFTPGMDIKLVSGLTLLLHSIAIAKKVWR